MKNITSLEKSIYKDILLTIIFVLVSIPIWLNFDLTVVAMEAQAYDEYNYVKYEFLNKASKTIMTYQDNDALRNCETNDILVYNDSNTLENYSLILKVAKDTDVALENIKINVNYNVDYLSNYHVYEDAESYYYVIDSDDIVASSQKYIISMWSSEAIVSENNDLDYEFVLL